MAVKVLDKLDEWVDQGLLDPLEADRIVDYERAEHPRVETAPIATEALGYVGGVLAVIAALLLLGPDWNERTVAFHLTVTATAALATAVGGWLALVQQEPALDRLGAFLWAASVAAGWGLAGVVSAEVLELSGARAVLVAAAAAAVYASLLYLTRASAPQQLALFITSMVAAQSALALPEGGVDMFWHGGLLWLFGLAWLGSVRTELLPPTRSAEATAIAAMIVGPLLARGESMVVSGLLLGLVTSAAFIVIGPRGQRTTFVVGGLIGLVAFVPQLVWELFGEAVAAPLVLFVVGLGLLASAIWSLRQVRGRRGWL